MRLLRWIAPLVLGVALFLAVGLVLESVSREARATLRARTVPTSMFDTGPRGEVLKRLRRIERVPNDGSLWKTSGTGRPGRGAAVFEKKRDVGPFLYSAASSVSSVARGPYIAEILASSRGRLRDASGRAGDWIEIHNPGRVAVELTNWCLTDDPTQLARWRFPAIRIEPDGRLVVFASGSTPGGGRDDAARATPELHANFRLDREGEYLALVGPDAREVRHEIVRYPPQRRGVSWGLGTTGVGFLREPTPGQPNTELWSGFVAPPRITPDSGLVDEPIEIVMAGATSGAVIRYTTDGRAPDWRTGRTYTGPIRVEATTVLRARAMRADFMPSPVVTRSYLHLESILRQRRRPRGFPARWGKTPADYRMDPRIARTRRGALVEALRALPMVSIVLPVAEAFGPGGFYTRPRLRGPESERAASVELIRQDGRPGFGIECGVRIQGNESRRPDRKKHSLRLLFRKKYGAAKLEYPLFDEPGADRFDTLILRSADDSWVYHQERVRESAQYLRDQWVRDTHRAMGHVAARGTFVHVSINGLYWGVYNLVERPDASFLAEREAIDRTPRSGPRSDRSAWDVLRFRVGRRSAMDGDDSAWREMIDFASGGLQDLDRYALLERQHLDIPALADYLILHVFAGAEDWALTNGNNVRVARRREENARFRFLVWDADSTFASGWRNDSVDYRGFDTEGDVGDPSVLIRALCESPEFRLVFADQVERRLRERGPLSTAACRARYARLAAGLERALLAESARWGDVRRSTPYLPEAEWARKRDWVLETWFPERAAIVRKHFQDAGIVPELEPPRVDGVRSRDVGGVLVDLVAPSPDVEIVYTIDGGDPRSPGGGLRPGTHRARGPITLWPQSTLRARCRASLTWSALREFSAAGDPDDRGESAKDSTFSGPR